MLLGNLNVVSFVSVLPQESIEGQGEPVHSCWTQSLLLREKSLELAYSVHRVVYFLQTEA